MTEAPIPPGEMTLDELRAALAPLIPAHAAFDGWSDEALAMAAAELRVPSERARLCFPGGAVEMIDAWFDAIDRAMAKAWPPERVSKLKIRQRIRDFVMYRIEVIHPHKEALRRAFAILARPQNAMTAARLAWRARSEEHTSELQSLMRISYAVFCLKKKKDTNRHYHIDYDS